MSFVDLTPETSVTPVPAPSSNGWEISVPFRIDPATGGVAVLVKELEIINQHLLSIILTMVGERVMNPTYGSIVPQQVFEPLYAALGPFMVQDLTDAIQRWEPSVTILSIQQLPSAGQPTLIQIAISYTYGPLNDLNTIAVQLGGGVNQVISL